MKNIVCVQIRGSQEFKFNFELKCLGLEIKKAIEAAGGKCLAIWANSILTIVVEGVPPMTIEALLKPFVDSVHKRGGNLSIVQRDAAQAPEGGLPADFCQPGAIIRQKLTRTFLFSLDPGAYVVSNLYANGRSIFAEQLGDKRSRKDSWVRARGKGADQKLCQVVWTEEEFETAAAGPF
jgi:hypothetical protein